MDSTQLRIVNAIKGSEIYNYLNSFSKTEIDAYLADLEHHDIFQITFVTEMCQFENNPGHGQRYEVKIVFRNLTKHTFTEEGKFTQINNIATVSWDGYHSVELSHAKMFTDLLMKVTNLVSSVEPCNFPPMLVATPQELENEEKEKKLAQNVSLAWKLIKCENHVFKGLRLGSHRWVQIDCPEVTDCEFTRSLENKTYIVKITGKDWVITRTM